MSPANQPPTETTVLLVNSRPAGLSSKSLSGGRSGFSPEILLIPVALGSTLATGIPSTTIVELLRQLVCRFWNMSHGDRAMLMAGGPSPPEFCGAPEITRYFAIVLAILGAITSIISITGCGIFSRISSHYGRKPAFLIVLTAGMMGSSMIAGTRYMPYWLVDWVFLLGMLFGMFSAPLPYLVDMYVVDGCAPDDRAAALSKIAGWAGLGTCVSYALGGSITTKTGNPLIVFYISAAIYATAFIYVASFLPESFTKEKRDALSCIQPESTIDGCPATTRFASLHIFEPLKMLIATHGVRNWRLVWCAAHTFVFTVANAYIPAGWLVLVTSKYHLTPEDTGLFFTVIFVSSTITLMVIVPPVIRFSRPYYRRKVVRFVEEGVGDCEGRESETSDRLHVHLAVVSCIVAGLSSLGSAASTTVTALFFSGICIGFSTIREPMIRSLVAGSVDPLKQGDALAAIAMVASAGGFLSPIIMGSILTATITTTPLLMFYVNMVVILSSSTLLFLVRDTDRYQKPLEA